MMTDSPETFSTQVNLNGQQNGLATKNRDVEVQIVEKNNARGCCRRKRPFSCRIFCKKYFWEGQAVHKEHVTSVANLPKDASIIQRVLVKHRRLVGIAIPAFFVWFCWLSIFIKRNLWHLFFDKYFMSITMVFGSMVAGMTSEGGGSVAFPVMTLAFQIRPTIARDFSLLIQSVGMTSAMFSIYFMKVKVEKNAILFCSIGGAIGMITGLEAIDRHLTPPQKKIGFVCTWFSFAFALFLLNWNHKRRVFVKIPDFTPWKAVVLIVTGIFGGVFSAISGSGVDICSFSILTLLFRVSEKTATPTSVVLMAINTSVGAFWRVLVQYEMSVDAFEFVGVCAPIVVVGAPLGSTIGTHFHRLVLAFVVYISDTVALISALVLVPMTWVLWVTAAVILVVGFCFFFGVSKVGQKLLNRLEEEEKSLASSFGRENSTSDLECEN